MSINNNKSIATVPNLQDFLRHQEPYVSGSGSRSITTSLSTTGANPSTDLNPTPPTTPTTIAFNVVKPKRKKPDPITTTTGIIPPCTECNKRFSSWKALFGHMRCHPERQWRGIKPPARFGQSGGGSPFPAASGGAQLSGEEYEVASSLILLANGPSPRDGPRQKRRWEEAGLQAVGLGCEHGGRHTCGVCLRGFSSGQALGGHMRCHWDRVEDNASAAAAASTRRDIVLDLNLPPPSESSSNKANANANDASVLDLRLGM